MPANRKKTALRIVNDAKALGKDWWRWKAWIEGPTETMNQIQSVAYRLHPTFPRPVRVVTNRKSKFALRSAGWGEFEITATVTFNDDRTILLTHWLALAEAGETPASRKAGEGREASRERLRVYVPASIADAALVNALTKRLAKNDVRVVTSVALEESLGDISLRETIRGVDAVLPVFSEPPSRWIAKEVQQALDLARPVISLLVGRATAPEPFEKLPFVRVRDEDDPKEQARRLVASLEQLVGIGDSNSEMR